MLDDFTLAQNKLKSQLKDDVVVQVLMDAMLYGYTTYPKIYNYNKYKIIDGIVSGGCFDYLLKNCICGDKINDEVNSYARQLLDSYGLSYDLMPKIACMMEQGYKIAYTNKCKPIRGRVHEG